MNSNEEKNEQDIFPEVDFLELIGFILSKKRLLLIYITITMLFGLLIAFTTPKEYKVVAKFIHESPGTSKGLSNLSGLASLAGVSISGSQDERGINPGLYMQVAKTTPFLLQLMSQEFYFTELGKEISLYDYELNYKETSLLDGIVSIPMRIIGIFKSGVKKDLITDKEFNNGIWIVSKDQEKVASNLREEITVSMDWELNIVSIEVEIQDPRVAAEVASFTSNYIKEFVRNYAISKSKKQLEFAINEFESKKLNFEKAQRELAQFRDRNQNMSTARASSQEELFQSKYDIAFNVYNQLAQQVENIKIQMNEVLPVFTILEPIKVPSVESTPNKKLIVIAFSFLGFMIGVGVVLFSYFSARKYKN